MTRRRRRLSAISRVGTCGQGACFIRADDEAAQPRDQRRDRRLRRDELCDTAMFLLCDQQHCGTSRIALQDGGEIKAEPLPPRRARVAHCLPPDLPHPNGVETPREDEINAPRRRNYPNRW